jgi:flagellar motor switch protein FliM
MSGEQEEAGRRSVRAVDFRLPRTFERAQLRGLELLLESASRPAANLLGAALRRSVRLELVELEQLSFASLLESSDGYQLVVTFGLHPLAGRAVILLPATQALRLVEMRLGGSGEAAEDRALTDLEQQIALRLFEEFASLVASTISQQMPVQVERLHAEPSLEFVQSIPLAEMCVAARLAFEVAEASESRLSIVFPYGLLRPVVEQMSTRAVVQEDLSEVFRTALAKRIADVRVVARVRMRPRTVSSQAVLAMRPGDVLPIGHRTAEPLSVVVDEVELYHAVLGQSGSRVAAVVVEEKEA